MHHHPLQRRRNYSNASSIQLRNESFQKQQGKQESKRSRQTPEGFIQTRKTEKFAQQHSFCLTRDVTQQNKKDYKFCQKYSNEKSKLSIVQFKVLFFNFSWHMKRIKCRCHRSFHWSEWTISYHYSVWREGKLLQNLKFELIKYISIFLFQKLKNWIGNSATSGHFSFTSRARKFASNASVSSFLIILAILCLFFIWFFTFLCVIQTNLQTECRHEVEREREKILAVVAVLLVPLSSSCNFRSLWVDTAFKITLPCNYMHRYAV